MTVGCSKPLIKAMLQRQILGLMSQVPENEITIKGWWTTLTRPPLKKYKLIALALPYEENIFGLLNVIHPNISCICWCMRFHWINLNYLLIKIANLVILITVMELKGHNSIKIQNIYKCICVFWFLPFSHQFALISCFLQKFWQQYLFIWNSSNYVLRCICWIYKNCFHMKINKNCWILIFSLSLF